MSKKSNLPGHRADFEKESDEQIRKHCEQMRERFPHMVYSPTMSRTQMIDALCDCIERNLDEHVADYIRLNPSVRSTH